MGDAAIEARPATDPVGRRRRRRTSHTSSTRRAPPARPKGAMVEHRGLVNLATSQAVPVLGFGPVTRSCSSRRCRSTPASGRPSPRSARAPRSTSRPGRICCPASQLASDLARPAHHDGAHPAVEPGAGAGRRPSRLRGARSSAERRRRPSSSRAGSPRTAACFNAYGPTEASVYCSIAELEADGRPPSIGRPIANAIVRVLDPARNLVPIGVPGELHIGGVGVGRGYLAPARAHRREVRPRPVRRAPATGSTAPATSSSSRPTAAPVFVGRIDHQVKMRGYRVELGEIETTLAAEPGVQDAVVIVREDSAGRQAAGRVRRGRAEAPVDVSELFEHLRDRLPALPRSVGHRRRSTGMPQTPSGKLDRDALPAPDQARPDLAAEYVAPRTPLEELVADVWRDCCAATRSVCSTTSTTSGGDSLLATKVVSRSARAGRARGSAARDVRDADRRRDRAACSCTTSRSRRARTTRPSCSRSWTLSDERPRLPDRRPLAGEARAARAAAAEAARGRRRSPTTRSRGVEPGATPRRFVLAQQRLWFLDQWAPGSSTYNAALALRLEGEIDEARDAHARSTRSSCGRNPCGPSSTSATASPSRSCLRRPTRVSR